jgi:hypothetical protein
MPASRETLPDTKGRTRMDRVRVLGILQRLTRRTPMFHLPVWARTVVLAAVVETAMGTATWAQVPHIPGGMGLPAGAAGAMSGAAEAAALMHYLQMLKHFDHNGNGVLDPSEVGAAKSGLGNLLGPAGNGVNAGANNGAGLLPMFDRNGNGQLDTAELQMAQMMMAMLMAGYSRPVSGVPMAMPAQGPLLQDPPPSKPAKRGRRKRAERIADFAKANNPAGAPMPPAGPKKKVKARAPMVERDQPKGQKAVPVAKAEAGNAPAND